MEAVNSDTVSEYNTWITILRDNFRANNTSSGDVIWALVARDAVFDQWKYLSETDRKVVAKIDNILQKDCREVVVRNLPSTSSTPQARAEGRWWWFLNEL